MSPRPKAAELVDELPVPVPSRPLAPEPHAHRVAGFLRRCPGQSALHPPGSRDSRGRAQRQRAATKGDRPTAYAPQSAWASLISSSNTPGSISEGRTAMPSTCHPPASMRTPPPVELAPDVRPLAHVDEPPRAVAQLLPADPQRGRGTGPQRCRQIEEAAADRADSPRSGSVVRRGRPPRRYRAAEQAQVRPQMQVAMKYVPLEKDAVPCPEGPPPTADGGCIHSARGPHRRERTIPRGPR